MEIPRTKGYTEIVKIAEAALNGDQEKARKYINKYLIKFPESDLVYPFTAILRGDLNPSGLHLCASEKPLNDASALPIPDVSKSVCDHKFVSLGEPNMSPIRCKKCGERRY